MMAQYPLSNKPDIRSSTTKHRHESVRISEMYYRSAAVIPMMRLDKDDTDDSSKWRLNTTMANNEVREEGLDFPRRR